MKKFTIKNSQFLIDKMVTSIISGGLHYFRIPREYWKDRLEKAKLMGCNTIESYVPWNMHEPSPGEFNFDGQLDLEAFIKTAADLDLFVIIRPTPYICGEFEFGGLPWWLLKDRNMMVRSMHPSYLSAIDRYYNELIPQLLPLQNVKGGPIILFQIENEFGYYSNCKKYPLYLKEAMHKLGVEQPLVTSDGPWGNHLEYGMIDGVLQTGNFGSGAEMHFKKLLRLQPDKPLMCMEFWVGWFDAWGDEHHQRPAGEAADELKNILDKGHVNIYMIHGGTNFGFTSGANYYDELKPDITSYDYDAPISESGELTEKYRAFQKVIREVNQTPDIELTTPIKKLAPHTIALSKVVSLNNYIEQYAEERCEDYAFTMEELDQGYGYLLYRFTLKGSDKDAELQFTNCRDRALVYIDGRWLGKREAQEMNEKLLLPLTDQKESVIDILVENLGRVNFGPQMDRQRKGFDRGIWVSNCSVSPVSHFSLPLDSAPNMESFKSEDYSEFSKTPQPGFYQFDFEMSLPEGSYYDTFIRTESWGKGVAFINGFNLGRFWDIGPQKSLYLPGPFLKQGHNRIIIFETEGKTAAELRLTPEPSAME